MEDAMIINKSSLERGFAHGSMLKSEFIELEEVSYIQFSLVLLLLCCDLSWADIRSAFNSK